MKKSTMMIILAAFMVFGSISFAGDYTGALPESELHAKAHGYDIPNRVAEAK